MAWPRVIVRDLSVMNGDPALRAFGHIHRMGDDNDRSPIAV